MELMDENQAGEYRGGKEKPLSTKTLQRWRASPYQGEA